MSCAGWRARGTKRAKLPPLESHLQSLIACFAAHPQIARDGRVLSAQADRRDEAEGGDDRHEADC